VVAAPKPVAAATPTTVIAPAAEPVEEEAAPPEEPKPEPSAVNFSPAAVFSWKRLGWNTFEFKALTPFVPGYRFEWTLGDGVVSNRHTLEHTYASSGEYAISLTVTDPDGKVTKDEAVVSVPFFSLQNRAVQALVALLGLLLLIGLIAVVRLSLAARRGVVEEEEEMEEIVEEEESDEPVRATRSSRRLTIRSED
jgi:hypothetical protein